MDGWRSVRCGGAGVAARKEAGFLRCLGGVRANCSRAFSNLPCLMSILCDFWKQETLYEPIIYVHFPLHLSLGQNSGLIATHGPVGSLPSGCVRLYRCEVESSQTCFEGVERNWTGCPFNVPQMSSKWPPGAHTDSRPVIPAFQPTGSSNPGGYFETARQYPGAT